MGAMLMRGLLNISIQIIIKDKFIISFIVQQIVICLAMMGLIFCNKINFLLQDQGNQFMASFTDFPSSKFSIAQHKEFNLRAMGKGKLQQKQKSQNIQKKQILRISKTPRKKTIESHSQANRKRYPIRQKAKVQSSVNMIKSFIVKENYDNLNFDQQHEKNLNLLQNCLKKQSFKNEKNEDFSIKKRKFPMFLAWSNARLKEDLETQNKGVNVNKKQNRTKKRTYISLVRSTNENNKQRTFNIERFLNTQENIRDERRNYNEGEDQNEDLNYYLKNVLTTD